MAACADRLAHLAGPVEVRLGKIVKLPEGEGYLALEAPLGVAGFFVVSRGEKTPWRFKLRTPSFSNVAALESVLVGVPVTALETALASIGYVDRRRRPLTRPVGGAAHGQARRRSTS